MFPSRTQFFDWLASRQPASAYRIFATIDENKRYAEEARHIGGPVSATFEAQRPRMDWYFTPLVFTRPQRANEYATGRSVLFADLDQAPVPPDLRPTAVWQTSQGSLQALWALSSSPDYDTWADLNKRLTYYAGADKGGWPGAKLLRVPGTINWKRGGVLGRWIEWNPYVEHSFDRLDRLLPTVAQEATISIERMPEVPAGQENVPWDVCPLYVRSMILKQGVSDRSMTIWKAASVLAKAGVTPEDAFALLWFAPWNKWKHKPARLWTDICRAYQTTYN